MNAFKHMVRIEYEAYPECYRTLQGCKNLKDFQRVYGKKLRWLVRRHFYVLVDKYEVIDLASIKPLSISDINEVLRFLKEVFNNKVIESHSRELAAYRLIKLLEKRGKLKILSDEISYWEGERFHELEFKLN